MRVEGKEQHLVLALFPSPRGVAYALFEGPLSLVDWGHANARGRVKNERCIGLAKRLIERHVPDLVVLEDTSRRSHRRSARLRRLNQAFVTLSGVHGIEVLKIPTKAVRKRFEATGAKSKHERAKMIAAMLPALSHRLPPSRKHWVAEDPRMAIFEVAALGLAFYAQERE
jgi:hypothetical protein